MDTALIDKVRELKALYAGYGQHTGTAYALRAARAALAHDAIRARFKAIGEIEHVEYGRWPRNVPDSPGADVRLLIVPDDEYGIGLDFDCCPDPATGRPDTGARWTKCRCVIYREPEDVHDAQDNARECQYGQPCGHKCDEAHRIESEGMYGVLSQYRDAAGGWQDTDAACWGFIGDDWKDSGYDLDAMHAALAAFDAEQTRDYNEQLSLIGAAH